MKFASVREFRAQITKMIEDEQPVMVTLHGEPMGVFLPLSDKEHVPLEIKREAFKMGMDRRAKLFGHIPTMMRSGAWLPPEFRPASGPLPQKAASIRMHVVRAVKSSK